MSNHDTNMEKQKKWHWVPLAGMAIGIVFVLFVALYEDDGGGIPEGQATDTNFTVSD